MLRSSASRWIVGATGQQDMQLSNANIGYAGYSRNFHAPGDRRRFCSYAARRELDFSYATLDGEYDAVLVAQNADLAGWTARKRREGARLKLFLDLTDPYFAQTNLFMRLI